MSPLQEIEVDTKIAFTIPSLQEIEQVGPDKRVQIISSVYTRCVSIGIIDKSSNKSESSLRDSRSKDFMTELERSSTKKYFARFKMHLSEALEDVDINEDFKCKWKELEAALYKAIGKEQNITRLSNFLTKIFQNFTLNL